MIEILLGLTLFGSFIWSAILIGLYFTLCIYDDVVENGISAFVVGIIAVIVFGIWSNVDFKIIWESFSFLYLLYYLLIGIIHAVIRSFFRGRAEQIKFLAILKDNPKTYHRVSFDIKEHVFRWILMWPISLVVWILKDIVKDIYLYLYKRFGKLFNYFMRLGMSTVPVEKDEKVKIEIKKDIDD